jgi:predicted DNA binding CopG/RHH family protein
MLRVPVDDLDRARRQAARKLIGYQTYIKILLREGLDRDGPRGTQAKQA